jgi:hypothetical protein
METVKADPSNIVRIKNFLDNDLYSYFYDYFINHPYFNSLDSRALYGPFHYQNEYSEDSEFIKKLSIYKRKILDTLIFRYGLDVIEFSGTTLRKWYSEEYQDPHSDCEVVINIANDLAQADPFPNFSSLFIEYAALVYLNDDYDGGEIFFPDHDIIIKPEPNEFICFPGTKYYIHGVNKVTKGSRFVMQDFVTTPKMMYIWQNFVVSDEDISFSDNDIDYYMKNKTLFSRSNIPRNFIFNRKKND